MLLNLAEFMEHDEKPLPIDIRTLGALARQCHAYAKALHYKEMEFQTSPHTAIEELIVINNKLGQREAAVGILKHAQQKYGVELKETWYEQLNANDKALEAYERRRRENPADIQAVLGKMRCLNAMGEYEKVSRISAEMWAEQPGGARPEPEQQETRKARPRAQAPPPPARPRAAASARPRAQRDASTPVLVCPRAATRSAAPARVAGSQ